MAPFGSTDQAALNHAMIAMEDWTPAPEGVVRTATLPATVFAQGGFQAAWRDGKKTHVWIGDYLGYDAATGLGADCERKIRRWVTVHPNIWLSKDKLTKDLTCEQLEPLLENEVTSRRGFDYHFKTIGALVSPKEFTDDVILNGGANLPSECLSSGMLQEMLSS